jgi:DNA polymerase eta
MLASKNIQPSVTTREGGYHWLTILAGELYVRLRDAREITEGLWPKTLVLGTRQGKRPLEMGVIESFVSDSTSCRV